MIYLYNGSTCTVRIMEREQSTNPIHAWNQRRPLIQWLCVVRINIILTLQYAECPNHRDMGVAGQGARLTETGNEAWLRRG